MNAHTPLSPIHILLADDDHDDRSLFNRELTALPFNTQLAAVEDGEKLMKYLVDNFEKLPDILFLDNNMPRKNGAECLREIKAHSQLKVLPVVMFSTHVDEDLADTFFTTGAHFYIRKTGQKELRKLLHHVLTLFAAGKFSRPARTNFVLNAVTTKRF
jgi:CheY-like chemotaxis protein